ncbi:MAG: hypothetical protein NZ840_13755, partial [Anaerolineales bacterium]|nr:hypothetical protein [Anaerolineales bacterium]MDW8163099.1 hypothetical protein [Anaerolineales bacterium]
RYLGALGDTRRSANDVTLWDHSYSVATLFKSALAYAVLAGWTNSPRDVRWRLLRVNFDVLALFAKATRIPDLLGYQRAVDQACAEVKRLIEEEYPLGNEVYRDTTGIYFTFPDLDLPAELDAEIRRRVEQVEPELAVRVAVTVGDGATAQDQLKTILGKARRAAQAELKDSFTSATLSKTLRDAWQNKEISAELCPICRLRPNAEDEDACQECLDRRAKRAQDWASNLDHTIWIDEVADETGRVALIAGAFG